jgi:hypothetical protein
MKYQRSVAIALAVLSAAVLACSDPAAPPTSPTGNVTSATEAAEDGSTLKVTPPRPETPIEGAEVQDATPELVLANSKPAFGEGVPVSYVFEVLDLGSNLLYQSPPVAPGEITTAHEIGIALESDRSYLWRAYAVHGEERGPVSQPAEFRVFDPHGPSCAHLGNELAIVQCRRAQYGFMPEFQRVEFLQRIAHDLNRAGAEHAPYGLLLKSEGHNCYGYSCDIICSNAGGVHRQWDVLSDENDDQNPVWSRLDRIAPRGCLVTP